MLNDLIKELLIKIFTFIPVDELLLMKLLSKYIHQNSCFNFLLDKNYTSTNINDWFVKNKLKSSKNYNYQYMSWRSRSNEWITCQLQKKTLNYIIYSIIAEQDIFSKLNNNNSNNFLKCTRICPDKWNIFDNDKLIARLVYQRYYSIKSMYLSTFKVFRLDNSLWFEIEYFFTNGNPRKYCIRNFNSLPWENSENIEDSLILNNFYNFDRQQYTSNNSLRRPKHKIRYALKFHKIRATKASCKNNVIKFQNNSDVIPRNIFELGKTDTGFQYGYKAPLHGLYSFIIACTQFIV